MEIKLFHFTCLAAAQAILADGFKDGEDGKVWFSRVPYSWGERSISALLEVMFEIDEMGLAAYSANAVPEEVWYEIKDGFVITPKHAKLLDWYAIPAAVVNEIGKTRLLEPHEREQLKLHYASKSMRDTYPTLWP